MTELTYENECKYPFTYRVCEEIIWTEIKFQSKSLRESIKKSEKK